MQNLLSSPSQELRRDLDGVMKAISRAFPLQAQHRKSLPDGIRELSRLLTIERDAKQAYWAAPRLVSAYIYYFLPWNLERLAWLLPGMDLQLGPNSHILDLGSGPLTLPLGLWLARPELRSVPLHFTCTDIAPRPMSLGRDIFTALAGKDSPWTFKLVRQPLEMAIQGQHGHSNQSSNQSARSGKSGQPVYHDTHYDLIMAGNVLNEIPAPRKGTLSDRLRQVAWQCRKKLTPTGRIFLLEPGTRLGGKLISLFRAGALQEGLVPLAPCPHWGPCPALAPSENSAEEQEDRGRRQLRNLPRSNNFSGWCHFSHPAFVASQTLLRISAEAALVKNSLHLSCMLLRKATNDESVALESMGFFSSHAGLSQQAQAVQPAAEYDRAGRRSEQIKHSPLFDQSFEDPFDEDFSDEVMEEDDWEKEWNDLLEEVVQEQKKEAKAVSPALLDAMPILQEGKTPKKSVLRIISDPIYIPDKDISARYACSVRGLGLLLHGGSIPSGAAVDSLWVTPDSRDSKSGALEAIPVHIPANVPANALGQSLPSDNDEDFRVKRANRPARSSRPSSFADSKRPSKFDRPETAGKSDKYGASEEYGREESGHKKSNKTSWSGKTNSDHDNGYFGKRQSEGASRKNTRGKKEDYTRSEKSNTQKRGETTRTNKK